MEAFDELLDSASTGASTAGASECSQEQLWPWEFDWSQFPPVQYWPYLVWDAFRFYRIVQAAFLANVVVWGWLFYSWWGDYKQKRKDKALYQAVAAGQESEVLTLLTQGADPLWPNPGADDHHSAVHLAASLGPELVTRARIVSEKTEGKDDEKTEKKEKKKRRDEDDNEGINPILQHLCESKGRLALAVRDKSLWNAMDYALSAGEQDNLTYLQDVLDRCEKGAVAKAMYDCNEMKISGLDREGYLHQARLYFIEEHMPYAWRERYEAKKNAVFERARQEMEALDLADLDDMDKATSAGDGLEDKHKSGKISRRQKQKLRD